jgi:RHS repeat-associated protein
MPRIGAPPTAYDTHHTHRGDVIVTRSGTSTTGTYDYTAFGNLQAQTGTDICRFKFSSKERDASTGFSYYGYRFYAPQWQRWISSDVIHERGGFNIHRFTHNDPLAKVDTLGMRARPARPPRLQPIEPPGSLHNINNEMNHGHLCHGGGALGDLILNWLANLINPPPPPTPEQLQWDVTHGLHRPPPGEVWIRPARPPYPKPAPKAKCPVLRCTYGGGSVNAPPTTVTLYN